jgi:hypothetical protein
MSTILVLGRLRQEDDELMGLTLRKEGSGRLKVIFQRSSKNIK